MISILEGTFQNLPLRVYGRVHFCWVGFTRERKNHTFTDSYSKKSTYYTTHLPKKYMLQQKYVLFILHLQNTLKTPHPPCTPQFFQLTRSPNGMGFAMACSHSQATPSAGGLTSSWASVGPRRRKPFRFLFARVLKKNGFSFFGCVFLGVKG